MKTDLELLERAKRLGDLTRFDDEDQFAKHVRDCIGDLTGEEVGRLATLCNELAFLASMASPKDQEPEQGRN
jgi:hypothetical protein